MTALADTLAAFWGWSALSGEQIERLVPVALALVAVFFMMLSLRRKQQRQAQLPRRAPGAPSEPQPRMDPELYRDLDELIAELQDLSRKISAEIDTRFAKLEAVIRDADRRIAVLHRLSRGQPSAGKSAPASDEEARYAVVYELADAGFTAIEIARELGKTPGEVELILNLRKKPEASRTSTGQ